MEGSVGGRRAASRVSSRGSDGEVARRVARLVLDRPLWICSPSVKESSSESSPLVLSFPLSPSEEPMTIMGSLLSCNPLSLRSGLPVKLLAVYRGERVPGPGGGVAPPFVRREGERDEVRAREPKVASWEDERECWRVMGEKEGRWSGEGGAIKRTRGGRGKGAGSEVCNEG